MSSTTGKIARTLASLIIAASFATFAPTGGASAQNSELNCNGHSRPVFLTPKPLRVNPGKCRFFRIKISVPRPGPNMKPPKVCLFATVWGSAKQYGPFCTEGSNFGMSVPGPIESVWSSQGLEAALKFCRSPDDCR